MGLGYSRNENNLSRTIPYMKKLDDQARLLVGHLNNKNGIIYRYRNDWLSG